ncbi:hypothetical protein CP10139811_0664 [Chlamydia ibidis]|uniref:Uncharacterized protein n=2 Tax=Chlamydia ibidis TaxID=1405396 RepID=S7KE75_9CHLA|nr:hypothetical protein [Chlamydia ibidis]EPP34511.1 hypothetical protein CP10139811_0664 [Chlamydia ibidis]EQM62277.1 hypothetical protein H359_1049 [Chlamydia ibidis 10-1398/6]
MQSYMFTLLCLASLVSLVSFDAVNARKRHAYHIAIEKKESFLRAQHSACAEISYQNKVKRLNSGEKISKEKEVTSGDKFAKVSVTRKRKYRSLKVPFSQPPNNSRFNLYALLQESPEEYHNPVSWYSIFLRLLRLAYVDTQCIPPGTETKIIHSLLDRKAEIMEGAKVYGVDIIETLTLPLEEADLLYTVLKGSKKAQPLLNFLHYEEKQPKYCNLNLIFMDPLLLNAVVNHADAYRDIELCRRKIWDNVKMQEEMVKNSGQNAILDIFKTRTVFRAELQEKVQILLSRYDLLELAGSKVFDYTLGSAGDYIFLLDPDTGVPSRCLCQKKILSNQKSRIHG